MTTLSSRISRRGRIAIVVAAVLIGAYAIAGFFVAPGLVKGQIERQIAATLHRRSSVGRVRVNPFALSVTVDSLRVADRDGALLFGWDQLYVNAELISLARRELDLLEVRLIGPYGRLVIRRDGTLNISDIADSMNAAAKTAPPSGPPPVLSVDELHIAGARFNVLDSATRRPFRSTIGPWKIDLTAFATRRDASSRYAFSGRTESGESFAWSGDLAILPVRSTGTFSLDSLRLAKYGPFYERTVSFDVPRGFMGVQAGYELNLGPATGRCGSPAARSPSAVLTLVERGRGDTAVYLPLLRVSGVDVDAVGRRAVVGAIALQGGMVNVSRARDGTTELAPHDGPAGGQRTARRIGARQRDSGEHALRRPPGAGSSDASRRTVSRCASPTPPPRARHRSRSTPSPCASTASRATRQQSLVCAPPPRGRRAGTLSATGTVRIWHRDGQLTIGAKDVSLRPFDAYLAPAMNMLITDGRLSSDATVRFAVGDTLHPGLRVQGEPPGGPLRDGRWRFAGSPSSPSAR